VSTRLSASGELPKNTLTILCKEGALEVHCHDQVQRVAAARNEARVTAAVVISRKRAPAIAELRTCVST